MIVTVQRFVGRASALVLAVLLCSAALALPQPVQAAQADQLETARQPAQPIRVRRHRTTLKPRAVLAQQIEVQSPTTQIQANMQHD